MRIGYVNVFVSDYARSMNFFADTLGLVVSSDDPEHGYASFKAGAISFGIAITNEQHLLGRHTGIGFLVSDIETAYRSLSEAGVGFEMPPTKQPWGGTLALFKDPDENLYYLDPGPP